METLTQAKNTNDKMGMIIKRVSVPMGLEELMEGLSREVLLKKPKDLYLFASEYFARLVNIREKSNKYKAHPVHMVQSVTRLRDPNIQLTKKVSEPRPTKHTSSRLSSLRSKSQSSPKSTESTNEKNIVPKSKERKSNRERLNSISKPVASRDVSLSKNNSVPSTETSSLQSTPREKRQSTVKRRTRSTQRNNNTKSHDQNTLKEKKGDKVKMALISPTVTGGAAVVTAIATSAALNNDVTNQEMFDSDILAKSTNISSLDGSEKTGPNTEKQPIIQDEYKNTKLGNESNALDIESLNNPLGSDILVSTTNHAVKTSQQRLPSNSEEKSAEKNEKILKKNNENEIIFPDKTSIIEDNMLDNKSIEGKKEFGLAEKNQLDSSSTETSQEIELGITSKSRENIDTVAKTETENTVRDKSIDVRKCGNIQDLLIDEEIQEITGDNDNEKIREVPNSTDDSKTYQREDSILNANNESQSENEDLKMSEVGIGRKNSEIDVVENKKIGFSETKERNDAQVDEEHEGRSVEHILKFNSVKDLLDFESSDKNVPKLERECSNVIDGTVNYPSNNGYEKVLEINIDSNSEKESENNKEKEQIFDKEKYPIQDTLKKIKHENEIDSKVEGTNVMDKGAVAVDTLNESQDMKENKQIFTNNLSYDITKESRVTTKEIEQIPPVKENLVITQPNKLISTEKEKNCADNFSHESKCMTDSNLSLSSDIKKNVVDKTANDSKLFIEANEDISIDKEKCVVDDPAKVMETSTVAIEQISSDGARDLIDEIGNGLNCPAEVNEQITVEEKHLIADSIIDSKYAANELISTDDKYYEINDTAKHMNTEENGSISANVEKYAVNGAEHESETSTEVEILSDKSVDRINEIQKDLKTQENISSVEENNLIYQTEKKSNSSIDVNEQFSHDKREGVHDDNINGSITITEEVRGQANSVKGIDIDDDNNEKLKPITKGNNDISSDKEQDVVVDTANEAEARIELTEQISSDESKDLSRELVKEINSSIEENDLISSDKKNAVSDDSKTCTVVMPQSSVTGAYSVDDNDEDLKVSTEVNKKLTSVGTTFAKETGLGQNDGQKMAPPTELSEEISTGIKYDVVVDTMNESANTINENLKLSSEVTEKIFSANETVLFKATKNDSELTIDADEQFSDKEKYSVVDKPTKSKTSTEVSEEASYVIERDLMNITEKQSGNNTEQKELESPDRQMELIDELLKEPKAAIDINVQFSPDVDIDYTKESEKSSDVKEKISFDEDTVVVDEVKQSENVVAPNEKNSSDKKKYIIHDTSSVSKLSIEANEQLSLHKEVDITDDITKKPSATTELKQYTSSRQENGQVDEDAKKTILDMIVDNDSASKKEGDSVENASKEPTSSIGTNDQTTSFKEKHVIPDATTKPNHAIDEEVSNISKELKPITDENIEKSSAKNEIVVDNTVKESKTIVDHLAKSIPTTDASANIPSNEEVNSVDAISKISKSTSETCEQIRSEFGEKNVVKEPSNIGPENNAENIENSNNDSVIRCEMEKAKTENVATIANLADIKYNIDTITRIMSSKLCTEKSGRIDKSVSQFLDTFLKYEQSDVFKIDQTEEQIPSGGKHVSDGQNSKESRKYVNRRNSMEKSAPEKNPQEYSLNNEKNSAKPNSSNGNRIRRVRSVGPIKLGENEQKSKIPTPTRRSAGRRPLVRQLETDSRDLEDQLSSEKELKTSKKGSKNIEMVTCNTSREKLNGTSKSCEKAETKKIYENSATNYAIECKKDHVDSQETNITKDDVFIAKRILQGIEGAHKLIESIDSSVVVKLNDTNMRDGVTGHIQGQQLIYSEKSENNRENEAENVKNKRSVRNEEIHKDLVDRQETKINEIIPKVEECGRIEHNTKNKQVDDRVKKESHQISEISETHESMETNTNVVKKGISVPSENRIINQQSEENQAETSSENPEKTNQIKMDKAAIIIQKIWKGFRIRKVKNKIGIVQEKRHDKEPQTKCSDENFKEVQSATKIQSAWRGFVVRKLQKDFKSRKLLEQEYAIIKIQAVVRGYLDRLKFEKFKNKNLQTSGLNQTGAPNIYHDSTKHTTTISDELQPNLDGHENSLVNQEQKTFKLNEGESIEKKGDKIENEDEDKTVQNGNSQEIVDRSNTINENTLRKGVITNKQEKLREEEKYKDDVRKLKYNESDGSTKSDGKGKEKSAAEISSKNSDSEESLQLNKQSTNGEVDSKHNNGEQLSKKIDYKNEDNTEEKAINGKVNSGYMEIREDNAENQISSRSIDENQDEKRPDINKQVNNFKGEVDSKHNNGEQLSETIASKNEDNTEEKALNEKVNDRYMEIRKDSEKNQTLSSSIDENQDEKRSDINKQVNSFRGELESKHNNGDQLSETIASKNEDNAGEKAFNEKVNDRYMEIREDNEKNQTLSRSIDENQDEKSSDINKQVNSFKGELESKHNNGDQLSETIDSKNEDNTEEKALNEKVNNGFMEIREDYAKNQISSRSIDKNKDEKRSEIDKQVNSFKREVDRKDNNGEQLSKKIHNKNEENTEEKALNEKVNNGYMEISSEIREDNAKDQISSRSIDDNKDEKRSDIDKQVNSFEGEVDSKHKNGEQLSETIDSKIEDNTEEKALNEKVNNGYIEIREDNAKNQISSRSVDEYKDEKRADIDKQVNGFEGEVDSKHNNGEQLWKKIHNKNENNTEEKALNEKVNNGYMEISSEIREDNAKNQISSRSIDENKDEKRSDIDKQVNSFEGEVDSKHKNGEHMSETIDSKNEDNTEEKALNEKVNNGYMEIREDSAKNQILSRSIDENKDEKRSDIDKQVNSFEGEVDSKHDNGEQLSETIDSKNEDNTEEKALNEKVNIGFMEIREDNAKNQISSRSNDENKDGKRSDIDKQVKSLKENSDKTQVKESTQPENIVIKSPEISKNIFSENSTTADKVQNNDGNVTIDDVNQSKPDFYRTDTVIEPEIGRKYVSHLESTSPVEEKDDNNNSQIKEETNLEREVRSAVKNILKSDEEKQASLKVEIQDVVDNIIHDEFNNDDKCEIDHDIAIDDKQSNVDVITRVLARVPFSEIPEHQTNEKREEAGKEMSGHALSDIGKSVEEEKYNASAENITNQNVGEPHKSLKENYSSLLSTELDNDKVANEQSVIANNLNKNENISESTSEDVSSVDSIDSVVTVIPNAHYKIKKCENEARPRLSRSHDNIPGVSKSLSTDALGDHVELIDQVQNTILDQISGKSVDSVSKFDIDQLRKELHEAASLYKSEDDNNHLLAHNEELLEYLSDFEPEENSAYDSRIIRTPNRELPDIEEEADSKEDENDDPKNIAQPGMYAEDKTEFCGVPLPISTNTEKLIDDKPLKDHVEIIDVDKLKHDHNDIIIDNNETRMSEIESHDISSAKTDEKTPKLLHTSELHDSVIIPLGDPTTTSPVVASSNLQHTSEFHDTLVVPLPSGSDLHIKNQANEAIRKKTTVQTRPESVDIGNQTSLQQAPAGAPVVTSRRSLQDSVDVVEAQASLRDTSPAKPKTVEPFTHQSPPHSPRFVEQEMESENNNNKKNNAITNPEKNMEAEAAIKIQAGFRGYQVRKQLKNKNVATDKTGQDRQLRRKSSGRKSMKDSDVVEKSAVKIQAGVRGFLVRRRQKKQMNSSASA